LYSPAKKRMDGYGLEMEFPSVDLFLYLFFKKLQ
jgi:hypothetical protein